MRYLLAMLIAFGVFAALPGDADARKKSRSPYVCRDCGPPPYAYQPQPRYYRDYRAYRGVDDSTDCIIARDLDPGGNYSGYPCWAQRALAPKKFN